MICHRTTVFPWNTVTWFISNSIPLQNAEEHIRGLCACWDDRAKSVVIKLEDRIPHLSSLYDAQQEVLRVGTTTDTDDFIEAHVFGPITRKAIRSVIVDRSEPLDQDTSLALRLLEDRCNKSGIRIVSK